MSPLFVLTSARVASSALPHASRARGCCWLDPRSIFRARVAEGRRAVACACAVCDEACAFRRRRASRGRRAVSGRARACPDRGRRGCWSCREMRNTRRDFVIKSRSPRRNSRTPARGDSRRLNEVGKALGQRRLDPRHGFAEIGELADVGESQVTLARGAEVGAGQERDAGVL